VTERRSRLLALAAALAFTLIPTLQPTVDAQLPTASLLGVGSCLLALAAAATLRGRLGLPLGWLTQAVAVGLGFATPMMFLMGGVFALLWSVAFVLGRRLDASR